MVRHPVRWTAPLLGVVLIWGSLGFVGYAAGWTLHEHRAQAVLDSHARSIDQAKTSPGGQAKTSFAPCVESPPQTGQLAGTLIIPALGLKAPVEQGTDDAELAVAAGHAPASVWPGAPGTSVFLAHDVSYFVHLASLKAGDVILYQDQCSTVSFRVTTQTIVNAGDPVYDTATPTLVLDTCWPTNALFYTNQRLLVSAVEDTTATSPTRAVTTSLRTNQAPVLPASDAITYSVPAPPDLVAQGLTLTQNEAPMGTMTLTGDPSSTWEESPGPMALEAAALEAYFGGIDAAEQGRADWWSAIATGATMPGQLADAQITGHDSPLDVAINSVGGVAQTVTLTTDVTVSGGTAPGTYHFVVTAGARGSVVTLTSWEMSNA